MKYLPLFAFFPFLISAQVSFVENPIDTSSAAVAINKIITADFNGDGEQDIAVSHQGINEIAIYTNDGPGSYSQRQLVSNPPDYALDIFAADLNGDSRPDLISLSLQDESLYWYPNQNGNFNTRHKVDSAYFFGAGVIAEDMNGDGTADLVAVDDTAANFYANDGQGNFTHHKISGESEFYSFDVADINGDNLPDVVVGSTLLFTFINNGDNTFTRDTRNEALISDFVFEVEMADIDGDGDQDVGIYYSNNNPDIDWYKNDGTGKFTFGNSITNSADEVKSMRWADLNGDQSPDFVTAYRQSGELVWMENDGQGNFGSETVLKTYPLLLRQVAVADADSDGDMDIFCSHNSKGLYYWENLTPKAALYESSVSAKLYPNPANSLFYIESSAPGHVRVFDLKGQELFAQKLTAGKNQLSLDLPKGTYILRWNDGEESFAQKLMME